jgi:hypothetical protein
MMVIAIEHVRGDNHLGRSATTILAGGEGWREGVARPEA